MCELALCHVLEKKSWLVTNRDDNFSVFPTVFNVTLRDKHHDPRKCPFFLPRFVTPFLFVRNYPGRESPGFGHEIFKKSSGKTPQ